MMPEPLERVLSDDAACLRHGCDRPRKGRHGRFCSDACRAAHWKAEHGGAQQLLDFAPADKPDRPTRCELILGRLLSGGPATGLDLLRAGGGLRYSARIAELRARGHVILGPHPWRRPDGTREERTTEPTASGHDLYELRVG